MRRIILFTLLLLSLGIIGYTLFFSSEMPQQEFDPLSTVASDALLVMEIDDFQAWHDDLKNESNLWSDLSQVAGAAELSLHWNLIDSLLLDSFGKDSTLSVIYSLHPVGQESTAWMMTLYAPSLSPEDIQAAAASKGMNWTLEKTYEERTIYKAGSQGRELYAVIREDAIQLSSNILCLEKNLRTGSAHLMSLPSFTESRDTRGNGPVGHVHIDWRQMGSAFARLFTKSNDPHTRADWGGWATADILSESNSLYLNGLVQATDSISSGLMFHRTDHGSGVGVFLDHLPASTRQFKFASFDPSVLDSAASKGISEGLFAPSSIEAFMSEQEQALYLIALQDEESLLQKLEETALKTQHLGQDIYTLSEVDLLTPFLDTPQDTSELRLYISEQVCVASFDQDCLYSALLQIRSGRTMAQDEDFAELQQDMDDQSTLIYYFDVAQSIAASDWHQSSSVFTTLSEQEEILEKFQALVLQYEPAGDGLFHQNILLRHNPESKKQRGSIWETVLPSPMKGTIHLHKNHYNSRYELLIQDTSNTVHLLDNRGQILWSRQLDGEIRSEVTQVDIYKNGKLQMLFNTPTSVYGLDRNGKDLDGFPVTLDHRASSPLAVMDYDKKRNYRLLIGLENGQLLNLDTQGELVDGWKFKNEDRVICGPIKHFTIKSKDYICTIDSAGGMRFLERNGKVRFGDSAQGLENYDGGGYNIIPGAKIKQSQVVYSDKSGSLRTQTLTGENSVLDEFAVIDPTTGIIYREDIGSLVILDHNRKEKAIVAHDLIESSVDLITNRSIGIIDLEEDLYHLLDHAGRELLESPVSAGKGILCDLDGNGRSELIICDAEGVLSRHEIDP